MTATAPAPAPLRRHGSSRRAWWTVPFLVFLGAAATLEAIGRPAAAAAVHLGLVLLLCLPVAGPPDRLRTVLVGVCVVRVVCLATPLPSASAVTGTAALGVGAWLVVALVWRAVERPAPHRGPPYRGDGRRGEPWRWNGAQRRVALSGVPVGVAAYLAAPSTGGSASLGGTGGAWAVLVLVALSAVPEELLFRGLLAPAGRAALGRRSPLFDGLVYAAWYAGSGSPALVLLAGAVGGAAAVVRLRTGRLSGLLVAHAVVNVVALVALPAWFG